MIEATYQSAVILVVFVLVLGLYALFLLWGTPLRRWLLPITDASRRASSTLLMHRLFSSYTTFQAFIFMGSWALLLFFGHLRTLELLLSGVWYELLFLGSFPVQGQFKTQVLGLRYDPTGLYSPYCGAAYAKAAICLSPSNPAAALICLRVSVHMAARTIKRVSPMFSDRLFKRVLVKIQAEIDLSGRPRFTRYSDLTKALAIWNFKRISKTAVKLVHEKSLSWSDPYGRIRGVGTGYFRYLVKAGSYTYLVALALGAVGAAFLPESLKSSMINSINAFLSSSIASEYVAAGFMAVFLLLSAALQARNDFLSPSLPSGIYKCINKKRWK